MARLLKVFGAINKLLYGKSLEEKLTFGAMEEHRLMQNTLCKLGSLKLVIKTFNNATLPDESLKAVVQLGIRLLEYCNDTNQDMLHQILYDDDADTMLAKLVGRMNEATDACYYFRRHDTDQSSIENGLTGQQGTEERYGLMMISMRFMIAMCDGHHRVMQDYLREQPKAMQSINIVERSVQLFCSVVGDNETMAHHLGFPELRLLELVVTFLTEAVEGPNHANQDLLASGPIVGTICRLLSVKMCKAREVVVSDSSGREDADLMVDEDFARTEPLALKCSAKALKSKCVRLLCALVEGVTDQRAIDKLCDSIDPSILTSRLTNIFLMNYYIANNPTSASVKQLQIHLNAPPGEWYQHNCREGDNIVILLKVLSHGNAAVAKRIAVDHSELWVRESAFRKNYSEGVNEFFAMKDQLRKYHSEQRTGHDKEDMSVAARRHMRGVYESGIRMLKLFGCAKWRYFHRSLKKRTRSGGTSTALQEDIKALTLQCDKVHNQALLRECWLFFDERICTVEIKLEDGELCQVHFPKPPESRFLRMARAELTIEMETETNEDKLNQFVERCLFLSSSSGYASSLASINLPFTKVSLQYLQSQAPQFDMLLFTIAVLNAFAMIANLEYEPSLFQDDDAGMRRLGRAKSGSDGSEEITNGTVTATNKYTWSNVNYYYETGQMAVNALGLCQLLISLIIVILYLMKRFPVVGLPLFRAYVAREEESSVLPMSARMFVMVRAIYVPVMVKSCIMSIVALVVYSRYGFLSVPGFFSCFIMPMVWHQIHVHCSPPTSYASLLFVTINELFGDWSNIFNLGIVLSCFGGFFYCEYLFGFALLKALTIWPAIANVVKAVYIPARSLCFTFVLSIIVVYLFALWGFFYFPESFTGGDLANGEYARSLSDCFIFVFHRGFLGGSGIILTAEEFDYEDPMGMLKMLYDSLFFFVVTVCLLNMVFGIMIDTFASLREQTESTEDNLSNYCFICCLHRGDFESLAIFDEHQYCEHDLMSFLCLIARVQSLHASDLNGTEFYVMKMLEERNLNWFPINKSSRVPTSLEQLDVGERVENLHTVMSEGVKEIAAQLDAVRQSQEAFQVRLGALERTAANPWALPVQPPGLAPLPGLPALDPSSAPRIIVQREI
jgi:hypothetical protein